MTLSGSFQLTSRGKISLHAFGRCFQLFLDTTLQKPENVSTESRTEKLPLVCFLLLSSFSQMVEKLCILFGPQFITSAYTHEYELKFSTQTNFDTLISNLKFYFLYGYDVMMTLFEKSVK